MKVTLKSIGFLVLVVASPIGLVTWAWAQYGVKAAAGLAINWLGLGLWLIWSDKK